MLLLKLILVLTLVANAQGLQLPDFKLPTIDFGASSVPKITPPSNFLPPPQAPLSIKSSRQLPGLLTGCTALGVRLGSSAFVLGWTPNISTSSPTEGYSLTLGPLSISDSSTVLPTAEARGIREPLVLYEYECSPYCRKVREVLNILDIPVLMKVRVGAKRHQSIIPISYITNNPSHARFARALPLVAPLLAPLFASLIAALPNQENPPTSPLIQRRLSSVREEGKGGFQRRVILQNQ